MRTPDKIYLNTPKVYSNSSASYACSTWATKEYDNCENTEYIRKDALLEWAKKNQYDSTTIVADNFWQEVIDKLNSM